MTDRDFEAMVLPHRDALYGHALALTRNADEAEDLVQETTLRALCGFDSFRADGPVRAWLLTILRNLFINAYRGRVRLPRHVSLDALQYPDPVTPSEPGPERVIFSKLENEAVTRAIAALPKSYREVLVMSDLYGLSYQQISDALELPIGTVRSRLSRARGRVRRALFAWRPEIANASKSNGSSTFLPA